MNTDFRYKPHPATAALILGITSMAAQILLMRELVCVFYGNELSLGIMLGAWLIWEAAGSIASKFLKARYGAIVIATLILLPITIFAVRTLRIFIGTSPGEIIDILPMISSSFLVLAPLCCIFGFTFGLLCKLKQDAGSIYIFEAMGNAAGALLFSFILVNRFSPFRIAALLGLLYLSFLLFCVRPVRNTISNGTRQRRALAIGLSIILLAFATGGLAPIEALSRRIQWRGLSLIHNENSIYGNLSVTKEREAYSFFEDGLFFFSTANIEPAEEAVHYPLLAHPGPRRLLIVGGGVSGLVREALKHPLEEIDYVELDPLVIKTALRVLPEAFIRPLFDPKVTIKYIDGRRFIKLQGEKRGVPKYDCIILNLPAPTTASLNRFYSQEFYHEAKQILSQDGIFAFGLSASENYLGEEEAQFLNCIYSTVKSVFKEVRILPGGLAIFLASDAPFVYSPEGLIERLKARRIQTKFVREYYIPFKFSEERMRFFEDSIRAAPSMRLNRDFSPVGYLYDITLWSSRFSSNFRNFVSRLAKLKMIHFALPIFVLFFFLLILRSKKMAIAIAMAQSGFSIISFQIVVILAFQVIYGYLYYKLGIIIATFMLGLSGGAISIRALSSRIKDPYRHYVKIQFALSLYSLALLFALKAPWGYIIFPVLAGLLCGYQFPLANKVYPAPGLLYGCDLLGASAGALIGAGLVIPVIGIGPFCGLLVLSNLALAFALSLKNGTI